MNQSYQKSTKNSTLSRPDSDLIKILSESPPPGWDGIFIRQCEKWLEQSERDGIELRLSQKQRDHLHRIAVKAGVISHV